MVDRFGKHTIFRIVFAGSVALYEIYRSIHIWFVPQKSLAMIAQRILYVLVLLFNCVNGTNLIDYLRSGSKYWPDSIAIPLGLTACFFYGSFLYMFSVAFIDFCTLAFGKRGIIFSWRYVIFGVLFLVYVLVGFSTEYNMPEKVQVSFMMALSFLDFVWLLVFVFFPGGWYVWKMMQQDYDGQNKKSYILIIISIGFGCVVYLGYGIMYMVVNYYMEPKLKEDLANGKKTKDDFVSLLLLTSYLGDITLFTLAILMDSFEYVLLLFSRTMQDRSDDILEDPLNTTIPESGYLDQ